MGGFPWLGLNSGIKKCHDHDLCHGLSDTFPHLPFLSQDRDGPVYPAPSWQVGMRAQTYYGWKKSCTRKLWVAMKHMKQCKSKRPPPGAGFLLSTVWLVDLPCLT